MIIVQLVGGLGNQLFQYAAGRALAQDLGRPLAFDISGFDSDPLRRFLLDRYHIPASPVCRADGVLLAIHRSSWRSFLPRFAQVHEIRESQHHFQKIRVPKRARKVLLAGYWQSEKYFDGIEGMIRAEVRLKEAPLLRNVELLRRIAGIEAVALHVRRGDYVTNPVAANFHGTCGAEYYQRAVSKLEEHLESPHFFVFSDDIPWAKSNLHLRHPVTFVDQNADDPCEELRLMAACKHFIIANSSFSWWGAWLGEHPGKKVIAPKKWFMTPEKDDRDQVPEAWIRI